MQKIKWGIIGCGNVTEVKSGPALQNATGSELIAVMRRNGNLAADYAKRHHVPKWYDDADVLINDPDVNAVYIATPPSSHKEYTLRVAAAGKPVYVEKPMAMNYRECREMIAACKTAGVPLFVAYYRRALPRFLKIKSWLDESVIGKIRSVEINFQQPVREIDSLQKYHWRIDPKIAGCGYFCDLGSHMLDLLQYFLGDITKANGYTVNQKKLYPAEDMVVAEFVFGENIHGAGTWNFSSDDDIDYTEIIGENGKIHYATFKDEPVILKTDSRQEEAIISNPSHIQQPLIQTIVNQLTGKGQCPSSGESAAQTNRVFDWILSPE